MADKDLQPVDASGRYTPSTKRRRKDRPLAQIEEGGAVEIPERHRSFADLTVLERDVLFFTLGQGLSDTEIAEQLGYEGTSAAQKIRNVRQSAAYKKAAGEALALANDRLWHMIAARDQKLVEGYDDVLTGEVEKRAAGGRSANAVVQGLNTRLQMRGVGVDPIIERGAKIQVGDSHTHNTLVLNMPKVEAEATEEEMTQILLGKPPQKFLVEGEVE